MLWRDEIEKQTQCIIILNKVFKYLSFIRAIQILFVDIDAVWLHVNSSWYFFFLSHILNALFKCLNQFYAWFGLLILIRKLLLDLILLLILNLLLSYLLLELLNLIKSRDKAFFEVAFDVVGNDFHTMILVIILAHVEFILDKADHLLIKVLAVFGITWSCTFNIWPVKLRLKSEELCASRVSWTYWLILSHFLVWSSWCLLCLLLFVVVLFILLA